MNYLKIGVLLSLIWAFSLVTAQAKDEDIPPGISQQDWVPLGYNGGIAIKKVEEADKGELGTALGAIYVKKDGRWYKFKGEPTDPKVRLLQK